MRRLPTPTEQNPQECHLDKATGPCYHLVIYLGRVGAKLKRPKWLIAIAIWRFIAASLLAIAIIAIAVFALPAAVEDGDTGPPLGWSMVIRWLLVFISLFVVAGIGLIKGKSWGRTLAMVTAISDLCWFPVGTTIGVLTLIYLFRPEVKEYFAAAQK